MPAYAITDFASAIPNRLRDDANKLIPRTDGMADGSDPPTLLSVLEDYAVRAIARYSIDRPLRRVSDVISDGSNMLDLPQVPGATDQPPLAVFDPESSTIVSIEYPLAQIPVQYLIESDFLLYQSPSGWQVVLCSDLPASGDTFRVTWTSVHPDDGSTIPGRDFHAVCDYAAHLAAMQLASIYVQTGDPSMSADVVNYRTKSQEYTSLANTLRKRYFSHLGIDDSATSVGSEVAAAISIGNQHNIINSGVDRLIHNRYTR